MDELDFYNPELDDDELDDDLVFIEEKPRKRRRKRNPEPIITVATPLLLLIAGYLGWCAYSSRYATWSWQPWQKLAGLTKPRLQLRRNTNNEEARRQAEFDKALEHALKPSVFTVEEIDVWKKPVTRDSEREIVSFIVP